MSLLYTQTFAQSHVRYLWVQAVSHRGRCLFLSSSGRGGRLGWGRECLPHKLMWAGWRVAPVGWLAVSPTYAYEAVSHFPGMLGTKTQFLLLPRQISYPLSHFLSPPPRTHPIIIRNAHGLRSCLKRPPVELCTLSVLEDGEPCLWTSSFLEWNHKSLISKCLLPRRRRKQDLMFRT